MEALTYLQALAAVTQRVTALAETETVPLLDAAGRVLAADVTADRDYPPAPRSIRDGYAVRSADLPGSLQVIGEVRAGTSFAGEILPGQCVEIMTGAPMPLGADAVVMVEHATLADGQMTTTRQPRAGENWTPAGCDAHTGGIVLPRGTRLRFNHIAILATVGQAQVNVYRQPRVAILATGDEVVPIDATPTLEQVRNSNSYSVAAQVRQAGGLPTVLPVAKDNLEDTRRLIAEGLTFDLLLLSGGVSAGKYDLVEIVLAEFGAEFFFTRVKMQPGQPLVFGQAKGKFFFGLLYPAVLQGELRLKPGLTRFLPGSLRGPSVFPTKYSGSGDVPALAQANVFIVTDPDRDVYLSGEEIQVLPLL